MTIGCDNHIVGGVSLNKRIQKAFTDILDLDIRMFHRDLGHSVQTTLIKINDIVSVSYLLLGYFVKMLQIKNQFIVSIIISDTNLSQGFFDQFISLEDGVDCTVFPS